MLVNLETTMTSKVEQFEDYSMYEFYEYGQTIGYVVVRRYGWSAFKVIHIEFNKNRIMAALKQLSDEYARKGKALYCARIPE
ncbi:MAG: hypothetical protein IJ587_07735 [Synergistaceae bacterium]|nr:hypothetical protein [Synergistaceae bacterium]